MSILMLESVVITYTYRPEEPPTGTDPGCDEDYIINGFYIGTDMKNQFANLESFLDIEKIKDLCAEDRNNTLSIFEDSRQINSTK